MLLFVIHHLWIWSIIGDAGFVVSSILSSAVTLLSFHMPTGKLGSRPIASGVSCLLSRARLTLFASYPM
jgi:hypothetical protein